MNKRKVSAFVFFALLGCLITFLLRLQRDDRTLLMFQQYDLGTYMLTIWANEYFESGRRFGSSGELTEVLCSADGSTMIFRPEYFVVDRDEFYQVDDHELEVTITSRLVYVGGHPAVPQPLPVWVEDELNPVKKKLFDLGGLQLHASFRTLTSIKSDLFGHTITLDGQMIKVDGKGVIYFNDQRFSTITKNPVLRFQNGSIVLPEKLRQ
jgi:hypothetical protein